MSLRRHDALYPQLLAGLTRPPHLPNWKHVCAINGPCMVKSGLVRRLAEIKPAYRHGDIEQVINTILDEIAAALARGDRIELRGFGVFTVRSRTARLGRDPKTGKRIEVDEKRFPFFKTGKELHARLNVTTSDNVA